MAKLTDKEIEDLQAEIARLRGELTDSQASNAESAARAAYFAEANTEIPTGRYVTINRCKNPWVKDADDQEWEKVKVPTFLFKIEMPPVGGIQIMLDGESLQHGQTYEMTGDRLRTVKEIIWRLQAHDAAIHGNDEDVWRPRVSKEINLRTGGTRNLPPNWLPGAGAATR